MPGGRPPRYSREEIERALAQTGGNASAAARRLGCDRVTVWRYARRWRDAVEQERALRLAQEWPAAR